MGLKECLALFVNGGLRQLGSGPSVLIREVSLFQR